MIDVPSKLTWLLLLVVLPQLALPGPVLETSRDLPSRHRARRNLIQLCEVLDAYTHINCLSINNYGCFCGYGSEGDNPVDSVDACCMVHDACYRNINCNWFGDPHVVTYSVSLGERSCKCTDSPALWPCSYQTCSCDVQLAECLSKATYNTTYRSYDRQQCK